MRRWLPLCLLLTACSYKVRVSSATAGVAVELPDGERAIPPFDYEARWAPFNEQVIHATAQGYRPLTLDLRAREVRLGRYVTDTLFRPATLFGAPRGEVRLVLVPEHGPVGTWSDEEVP